MLVTKSVVRFSSLRYVNWEVEERGCGTVNSNLLRVGLREKKLHLSLKSSVPPGQKFVPFARQTNVVLSVLIILCLAKLKLILAFASYKNFGVSCPYFFGRNTITKKW